MESKKKKAPANKEKVTPRNSPMQVLGERVERCDFHYSLACATSGITFVRIAIGDIDDVREELRK